MWLEMVGVELMKRHKMVNLCPTTYEIARNMPNFSKFVREQLLKQDKRNTFVTEYHMWCPDHPEYVRVSDHPPRFGMYCTTCERQMEGKWVQV